MPAVDRPGLSGAATTVTPSGGRPVLPVAVDHADGRVLLGPLRAALSGAGPALAPHARGRAPDPAAVAPLGPDEDDPGDPVAAVVSTTGSTGAAKHVLLPASALLASAGATHDHLGGSGRWLLAVPAHTVAGVQVVVRSLVAGTSPAVLDLSQGFDADGFAAAAAAMTGTGRRYTSLVPTQLRRLLQAAPATGAAAALAGFDAVLVGGAAMDAQVREQAHAAGVRVVTTYGMTETCGGCVYDGVPLPGVQVRVEPLPGTAGPVGRVVLSGPVVARGYRGGPTAGAGEGFDRTPAGGRCFRTADLGEQVAGRLELRGRTDDVVVSGGVNVALDAVAAVVRALPGVQDALAVGVPDLEWGHAVGVLVQPVGPGPGPGPDLVREAVRERLGRAAVPRWLRTVTELPTAGVGKPDRRGAVRLLQAGPQDADGPGLRDDVPPSTPRPEEPTA
ncbi:AMP-binding protein [Jannaschia sp. R86511]|uniref:AMP-binding protein n=1 Tax=Jannaschia sp. R86511 TaxID=3093853 RepID=UPI0036D3CA80